MVVKIEKPPATVDDKVRIASGLTYDEHEQRMLVGALMFGTHPNTLGVLQTTNPDSRETELEIQLPIDQLPRSRDKRNEAAMRIERQLFNCASPAPCPLRSEHRFTKHPFSCALSYRDMAFRVILRPEDLVDLHERICRLVKHLNRCCDLIINSAFLITENPPELQAEHGQYTIEEICTSQPTAGPL